ncbi:hypothetical protein GALMADRAFT_700579 [Galerina marginata CBS 339.88]|uniref:Cytochrome c oxidase assembly factor 3 n=1 Tax=Galerina marginata (strain CBS 339.88) TaxID=685588 RepID=A0A067TLV4_GALM3|nr:hypothetical protein GALMADRAFT_700579 [Galerina marginata CBS 339.88]
MSQYADRKESMKSYRPKAGTMSPGLKRAREPYRLKNAILGVSLAAFAVGVWAYSISAVKQDVFDDVDEEAESLASTGTGTGLGVGILVKAAEEVAEAKNLASVPSPVAPSPVLQEVARLERLPQPRGLLPRLEHRLPWLLDPERKTLVWGAPPVDSIGKMGWP